MYGPVAIITVYLGELSRIGLERGLQSLLLFCLAHIEKRETKFGRPFVNMDLGEEIKKKGERIC